MSFSCTRVAVLFFLLVSLTYQMPCNSHWSTEGGVKAICKEIGNPAKFKCDLVNCSPKVSQVSCPDGKTHKCDGAPTAHEYISNQLVCRNNINQFFKGCSLTVTPDCDPAHCVRM
ncbi:uncharacterized protein MELLADRAFT_124215 [Melampsora larici-populina 98AG31]|uniref:Secreted protein n=1 Tax=Melampsora larici-populina (strain 98AG31 / pathotype 3-4-7) TaxID=747676 RepID=F4RJS2_MELLP|nr:uncharacterized protein MELLADRAFT_124215 [Melampsora larici-populina 98AG31]EGG07446.1 secreted protein [Melampsora larici-populina 98AG31]